MIDLNALVYIDDDPLLSGLISGWATRAGLAWVGQAHGADDAVHFCSCARGRLVLLSTEVVGARWKDIAIKLRALDTKPSVILFAKRFTDAFLYCAKRSPISGVIARSADAEREFHAALAAIRGGRQWFCETFEDAISVFEQDPHAFFKVLSGQELALLHHFGLGLPDRVIAESQNLAPSTIQTHRKHVMRKLGVHSARDLVCWAIARGVVSASDFSAVHEQVLSAT